MSEVSQIGIPSIYQALNAVMKDVTSVEKTDRNAQQGWNFRGIDATLMAVGPAFRKHGVVSVPEVLSHTYEVIEVGSKRTPMGHAIVQVSYRFFGPAGDCAEATVLGEAADSGDKACAKAMSVAFRTALLQVLAIPTGEPDPDSESYERSSANTPNTANTRIRQNRENRPNRENDQEKSWSDKVAGADSVETLREVWKAAGAAGALQEKTADGDGQLITLQDLLYKRADELSFQGGNGSTPPAAS